MRSATGRWVAGDDFDNAAGRITDALDILAHDGYLEGSDDGHRFASRLLKD